MIHLLPFFLPCPLSTLIKMEKENKPWARLATLKGKEKIIYCLRERFAG